MLGTLAVAAYLAVCVGVMFVEFVISTPQPEALIVVDFGEGAPAASQEEAVSSSVPRAQSAPAEPEEPEPEGEKPVQKPVEKPKAEPAPERKPNPLALFPGNANAAKNASAPSPTPAQGGGGGGVSLEGRYLVGDLPQPAYTVEVEGRVVIRITVDAAGVVTGAVFEQSGSTTNNGSLVAAARAAALRARFTADEATVQTGTITYIFKLNR